VSVRNRLRSKLLSAYISEGTRRRSHAWHEARRKLTGKGHVVTAFLQIDDPYSYLLSRYLPDLAGQFEIDLRVCLSRALGGDYDPAGAVRADYAVTDVARVAAELGIPFLDRGEQPLEHLAAMNDAVAARVNHEDFSDAVYAALESFWRGDAQAAADLAVAGGGSAGETVIAASQRLLDRMGHYNSAMLHYGGEWFWGVDRLQHLAAQLEARGLGRGSRGNPRLASIAQVMHIDLPVRPPAAAAKLPPLDLFYSFRSPYSQLCLRRVFAVADAFGLELVLRPVLPMMMRGMAVPPRKIRYIVRDAAREAELHGVPFGNCVDPLGAGVERCHAVFAYAESEKRGREFLLNASEMIWDQAVDVTTDKGLRRITAKTGLFWPEVKQALENDDWRETEAENRQLMLSLGGWGVPTLCLGDFVVWGQDRIWLLVRQLEELCDTGEGILV
jgi:2-hydroxychromene-2-carboxylate isomerase